MARCRAGGGPCRPGKLLMTTARFPDVPEARRLVMSKVKGENTRPEMVVRSTLHLLGYRYVLHDRRRPGRPDLSFPSRRLALFVHGCFWHRHPGCKRAAMPTVRGDYWRDKFRRNVERDERTRTALAAQGWHCVVVWECELSRDNWLDRVCRALGSQEKVSDDCDTRSGARPPSSAGNERSSTVDKTRSISEARAPRRVGR
jgi:DNA mismatch endonuclease (patch repair protein)